MITPAVLSRLPHVIHCLIARHADRDGRMTSRTWKPTSDAVKQLSLVNRELRAICNRIRWYTTSNQGWSCPCQSTTCT